MDTGDRPALPADLTEDRSSRSPVSVAILAAMACIPLVIAAGFLTERSGGAETASAVPADISALGLRGKLDAGGDARPPMPMRAGF